MTFPRSRIQPIKLLLVQRQIRQTTVAAKVGKSAEWIGKIVNGQVKPSAEMVRRLSELLGEPPETLFTPDMLRPAMRWPGERAFRKMGLIPRDDAA